MQKEKGKRDPAREKKKDEDYYRTVPKRLITWGSEPFLKKYTDYMKFDDPEEKTDIFEFENLILEIRTDLGCSNDDLKEGDLLRVFLKGVDQGVIRRRQSGGSKSPQR